MLAQAPSADTVSILLSYTRILGEMTELEEARQTILSSSLFTRTLRSLLHHTHSAVVAEAVALLSRECEEIDGYADVLTQCFREEATAPDFPYAQASLPVLMACLRASEDPETVVGTLKFLALLVYSVRSLSKRVFVGASRRVHNR